MIINKDFDIISFIFESMEDSVCVINKYGELLYSNPAAEKLLGLQSFSEDTGKKIWEAIPYVERNDDLIQLFIEAVSRKEPFRQVLVDYENNKGELFRIRVGMSYSEAYGGLLEIIINDLTEFTKVTDAFSRYTSPRIADYVLHTPKGSRQGGQSRRITVLMSDLRGFTAMSTIMAPKSFVEMLNHYFEKMVEVIERFQGNVIEFLGDGIFVIFNAPNNDRNHAKHAVACAIEMQNAMDEVNEWNRERGYPDLTMGIGIESGPAVVGNLGSSQKMKYGCVGETVNMAGRLEKLTVGGQILVSENACRQTGEPLLLLKSQEFMPKGGKEPLTVYDIAGIGEKHQLRNRRKEIVWRKAEKPHEIIFYFLNEAKEVEKTPHKAWITALSEDGLHIKLRPEEGTSLSGDLMIDNGEKQYGKIIGQEETEFVFCFTSTSDQFSSWIKKL